MTAIGHKRKSSLRKCIYDPISNNDLIYLDYACLAMTCITLTGLDGVCTYLVDLEWPGLEGVRCDRNRCLDSKISIEHISQHNMSDSCLQNFFISIVSRASHSASALAKQVRPTTEGFCVEK